MKANEGPSNRKEAAAPALVIDVSPGRLGIDVTFVPGEGARVVRVDPACPFWEHIKAGDAIVAIDGKRVTSLDDFLAGRDRARKFGIRRADDVADGIRRADDVADGGGRADDVVDGDPPRPLPRPRDTDTTSCERPPEPPPQAPPKGFKKSTIDSDPARDPPKGRKRPKGPDSDEPTNDEIEPRGRRRKTREPSQKAAAKSAPGGGGSTKGQRRRKHAPSSGAAAESVPGGGGSAPGSFVFTRLTKSRYNLDTKACICDWGQECQEFKAYFDTVGHPLRGYCDLEYSNTCDAQNFWKAVCHFVKPDKRTRDHLLSRCEKYNAIEERKLLDSVLHAVVAMERINEFLGGHAKAMMPIIIKKLKKQALETGRKNHKRPRYDVARHHFPLELVKAQANPGSGRWLTPMTIETALKMGCYEGRTPPFLSDPLFKYDPTLGEGKSDVWRSNNESMIMKAPCATKGDVRRIAALHQNSDKIPSRVDMDSIRRKAAQRQLEKEDNERTPEQWNDLLSQRDALLSQKESLLLQQRIEIGRLTSENMHLKSRLISNAETAQKQLADAQGKRKAESQDLKKSLRQARRTITGLERSTSENNVQLGGWHKVRRLFSKSGGLSRLSLFNDDWHEEHADAAKTLWGYPSWEETKANVGAYFPEEIYGVDTSYDPSKVVKIKSGGEFAMPDLSPFEACLLCRMFFRGFTEQDIISLVADRHRTSIGRMINQWAPRWGDVGDDLQEKITVFLESKRK